jgi:spore coat polysaccharide biosynthesis predicted glycosyltransferase SpsG
MEDNKTQIGYRIKQISTTKFSFEEIENEKNEILVFDSLDINIKAKLDIDRINSEITILINSEFSEKENKSVLIKHSGKTVFKFESLEILINKENNNFEIPNNLLVQLYILSYSHARALLAAENSRTIYKDKYFLPIIDPKMFIQK